MWRCSTLLLLTVLCPIAHSLLRYHFIDTALSWSDAQAYCRRSFTDLATIFNIEDMNRLVNSALNSGGSTQTAWIGLYDNLTNWRWSYLASHYHGNVNGSYRNWDYRQPDNFNGEEMCVKMWSGGVWEDSKCFLRNPFICGTNDTRERFVFVNRELSWSAARKYCRKHHTDLADVNNKTENLEIQILAKNRSVWIGLHRTRQWSDGSNSTYRNWRAGQPDNVGGRQGCIATHLGNAGLWSDERCSRELTFICYSEENGETPDREVSTTPGATGATTSVTQGQASGEDSNGSTTEIEEPTTGYGVGTYVTSSEEESTSEIYPTEEPTTGYSVGTYVTSSEEESTPEIYPTEPVTDETTLGTESSEEPPTPEVDPTPWTPAERKTEHVMNLRVALSSKVQLSEDDIERLILVEFHDRLIEMGLPVNIKVGVRETTTRQRDE